MLRPVLADEPPPPAPPPPRDLAFAWGFSGEGFARRLTLPRMTVSGGAAAGLRTDRGTIAGGEAVSMLGLGTGGQLVIDDRWIIPVASFDMAFATGRPPDVVSSLDGSIAREHLSTAKAFSLGILGFGARAKHRRWMAEATFTTGFSVLITQAEIARGRDSIDVGTHALSLYARASVVGCRRVDPETRVCGFISPALYEFGFFNGGSIGLRVEVGP